MYEILGFKIKIQTHGSVIATYSSDLYFTLVRAFSQSQLTFVFKSVVIGGRHHLTKIHVAKISCDYGTKYK